MINLKDNKTKPENPLKELPKTGMKIITSWITWVFIGILGLYLILRKDLTHKPL